MDASLRLFVVGEERPRAPSWRLALPVTGLVPLVGDATAVDGALLDACDGALVGLAAGGGALIA